MKKREGERDKQGDKERGRRIRSERERRRDEYKVKFERYEKESKHWAINIIEIQKYVLAIRKVNKFLLNFLLATLFF